MDQEQRKMIAPQDAINLIDYTLAFKRVPGEMLPTRTLSLTAQQFEEIRDVLAIYAMKLASLEEQDQLETFLEMPPRHALTSRVDKIENLLAKWDDRFHRFGQRLASSESLIARLVSQLKDAKETQDITARRVTNMYASYGPEIHQLEKATDALGKALGTLESKLYTLGAAWEEAAAEKRQREIDIGQPIKIKPARDDLLYDAQLDKLQDVRDEHEARLDDLESKVYVLESKVATLGAAWKDHFAQHRQWEIDIGEPAAIVRQGRDRCKQNQHDLKLLESKLTQAKIDWSADWKRIWKRDAEQKERMDDLEEHQYTQEARQDNLAELAAENKERIGKLTAMVLNPAWPHASEVNINVTTTEPVTEGDTDDPRD